MVGALRLTRCVLVASLPGVASVTAFVVKVAIVYTLVCAYVFVCGCQTECVWLSHANAVIAASGYVVPLSHLVSQINLTKREGCERVRTGKRERERQSKRGIEGKGSNYR